MSWLNNFFFIIGYYLKRAHWLSLDVVGGAMLVHIAASRLPDGHGKVSWSSTALVGIVVFGIYVLDRFLDNRKGTTTPRHHFQAQNEALLLKTVAVLSVFGAINLFWLPPKIFLIGFTLAFLVGLYLFFISKTSLNSHYQLLKEPLVAFIYTAGTWATAISASLYMPWESVFLMLLFGLLAFQNLLLFSWFESFDLEEGYSLAIAWGTETTSKVLTFLCCIIVLAAFCAILFTSNRYCVRIAVVIAMMSVFLYILKIESPSALKQERYRWLGDGVFLLMLWLL